MRRPLSSEDLDLSGEFFFINCRRTATTTVQRLLLITTTTLVMLMLSSSSSSTASTAILPPHVLLKSDADEGTRAGTGDKTGRRRKLGPSAWRLTVSDELPLRPPFPGFADKDSLPTRVDRDPRVLAAILGGDFDAAFMSIERPEESVKNPNGTFFYNDAAIENISTSFRVPKFDYFPGRGSKVGGKRQRMLVGTYLAAYTYCPVHRKWIDLGRTFWPRWIRQGDCSRSRSGGGVRSCSFPPGMSCKPQSSTSKRVLWWHCQSQGRCQWIRIVYPVVTACRCSC